MTTAYDNAVLKCFQYLTKPGRGAEWTREFWTRHEESPVAALTVMWSQGFEIVSDELSYEDEADALIDAICMLVDD